MVPAYKKRAVVIVSLATLAFSWPQPADAQPLPRVDLPEGLSLVYEPFDVILSGGLAHDTIEVDYRKDNWAGGIAVTATQLGDPATFYSTSKPFYDPSLVMSWSAIEVPWLTAGIGGVLATATDPNNLHTWKAGFGICASIHADATFAGQDWRWFFDPSVTLGIRTRDGSVATGGGTGFVAGVGINKTIEVMFGSPVRPGVPMDATIAGIRTKL